MAVTHRLAGQENDGNTASPALAKSVFTGLANNETIVVALNHTGVATALAPTAPFTLVGELVAPSASESSLHVYIGKSANWAAEAATFTFPISTARGGCLLGWVIAQGDSVDLAAVQSLFERETSATPTIGISSTRNGSLLIAFSGAKPASGTISGAAAGSPAASWVERIDLSVSATSFLHGQTLDQATAGAATAQPTFGGVSASYAQALIVLPPPLAAPTISSRSPAAGQDHVALSANVSVTFTTPMDSSTMSALSVRPLVGGPPLAGFWTSSGGGTVWTFNPNVDFTPSTTYLVTVDDDAESATGLPLASTESWSFVTTAAASGATVAYGAPSQAGRQWALEVQDRDGNSLGMLDAHSFKLTLRLNAGGDLTGTLWARAQGAGALDVYKRRVVAYRRRADDPGGVRDAIWVGDVHELRDVGDDAGNEVVSFTCRDAWANVERRIQPWNSSWGPDTLDHAVEALIADAAISAEDPAGLDDVYDHGLSVASFTLSGWPVGTWAWEARKPIGELFRTMQEGDVAQQGFWWTVAAGTMRIALTPDDLSAVTVTAMPSLEYGPGTRNNVASYEVERIPPINSVLAIGRDGLTWLINSETSGDTYGLWPTIVQYGDVDSTAELDVLARGVWQVFPTDSIKVVLAYPPDPDRPGTPVPMLWDDFEIGNALPVLIRGARRTITGTCTVREATVVVDEQGVERLESLVLDLPETS